MRWRQFTLICRTSLLILFTERVINTIKIQLLTKQPSLFLEAQVFDKIGIPNLLSLQTSSCFGFELKFTKQLHQQRKEKKKKKEKISFPVTILVASLMMFI